jgi:tetratricopeptide (TPR) repeat protein
MKRVFVIVHLFVGVMVSPALAAGINHEKEYNACIRLAQLNPEKALPAAAYWLNNGGGVGAKHCKAVALVGSKRPGEAAVLFEELANDPKRPDVAKAQMLAQGAQAWILGKETTKGIAALDKAITLAPTVSNYRVDRAVAYAALGNYPKTLEDLTAAIDRDPKNAEAYTFRASAYRFLNKLPEARLDIDKALQLSPGRGDALLERGVIKVMTGDAVGGRADWQQISNSAPGSPLARAAEENIARLAQVPPPPAQP